jgi:hypothetical protein
MNQKVDDLNSKAEEIVALLRTDFAFTRQEEARIASMMGTLRDAFGRWRKRQKEKKHPTRSNS